MPNESRSQGLRAFLTRKQQCWRLENSGVAFVALVMWAWTCRGWYRFTAAQRASQIIWNVVPTAALAASLAFPKRYRLWRPLAVFVSRVALVSAPASVIVIKSVILGEPVALRGSAALGATMDVSGCPIGTLLLLFYATRAMGVCVMAFDNDLDVGPAAAAQVALAVLSRQADGALCTSPLARSPGMLAFVRLAHFLFYGALAPEAIESPGTSFLALCYALKVVAVTLPVVVAARRQAAREAAQADADEQGRRREGGRSAAAAGISAAMDALHARPMQGALMYMLAMQLLWAACYSAARRTCAAL